VSCGRSQLIFSPPNIVLSFNAPPVFAAKSERCWDVLVLWWVSFITAKHFNTTASIINKKKRQ